MQLGKKRIRETLAVAAASLVGAAHASARPVDVDAALLYYAGFDRVSATEAVVDSRVDLGSDRSLKIHFVYDALTGASANGATPSQTAQTFTRPSGKGSYIIQPTETPLDDTFHDSRQALSLSYERPLGRLNRAVIGISGSSEYDFLSFGANATFSRDFDLRNRTVTVGLSVEQDLIKPVGGAPIPFARMATAGTEQPRQNGDKDKTTVDFLAGLTQVLNRSTLMQINYSRGSIAGYLTDPYKILSVVTAEAGDGQGEPIHYLYENRPGSRVKQSLYWIGKRQLGKDVVDLSYRYFWDDWGINSHTFDLHYRWNGSGNRFVQPHLRYYRQTAADFYRYSLTDVEALPSFASADYRLGEFQGVTAGLKYGQPMGPGRWSIRVEYYLQTGDNRPAEAFGEQQDLDLFPSVGSAIIQMGYAQSW